MAATSSGGGGGRDDHHHDDEDEDAPGEDDDDYNQMIPSLSSATSAVNVPPRPPHSLPVPPTMTTTTMTGDKMEGQNLPPIPSLAMNDPTTTTQAQPIGTDDDQTA